MKPVWIVAGSAVGASLIVLGSVAGVRYVRTQSSPASTVTVATSQPAAADGMTDDTATGRGSVSSSATDGSGSSVSEAAGEYWCRSYNIDGAGGSCSLQRRLYLRDDGSYDFGSTGRFSVSDGTVTFDGDLASRGPATLTADRELRWEFTRDGQRYTITYYWRQAIALSVMDTPSPR